MPFSVAKRTKHQNLVLLHIKRFFFNCSEPQLPHLQDVCCSLSLSHVWLFGTPWTGAHQAPLFMRILQAGILEWVAMLSSRDLLNPRIKPRSPALQAHSHHLSYQRSPRILEWVAYRGSSQCRNRTEVSCIAGEFFTNWAIREAPPAPPEKKKKQNREVDQKKKAKQRGPQEQNQGWGTAEREDSVIKSSKQPTTSIGLRDQANQSSKADSRSG